MMFTPAPDTYTNHASAELLAEAQRLRFEAQVAHYASMSGGSIPPMSLGAVLGTLAPMEALRFETCAEWAWGSARHDDYAGYQQLLASRRCPMTPALEMLYLVPRLDDMLQNLSEGQPGLGDDIQAVRRSMMAILRDNDWLAEPGLRFPATTLKDGVATRRRTEVSLVELGLFLCGSDEPDPQHGPATLEAQLPQACAQRPHTARALAHMLLEPSRLGIKAYGADLAHVCRHLDLEELHSVCLADKRRATRLRSLLGDAGGGDFLEASLVMMRRLAASDLPVESRRLLLSSVPERLLRQHLLYARSDAPLPLSSLHDALELVAMCTETLASGEDTIGGMTPSDYWALFLDAAKDFRVSLGAGVPSCTPESLAATIRRALEDGMELGTSLPTPERALAPVSTFEEMLRAGYGDEAVSAMRALSAEKRMRESIDSEVEPTGCGARPRRRPGV